MVRHDLGSGQSSRPALEPIAAESVPARAACARRDQASLGQWPQKSNVWVVWQRLIGPVENLAPPKHWLPSTQKPALLIQP
eukprot:scaffold327_cov257-Pinguiococcus_pyrenoidosus.AAC.44